ncbi:MAG: hypothetical protein BWK80_41105 [Desulfobacteraceae bacterium IS3]|nr:MAG: hypothetical protein BWK80_41105 [Desulfobacteraceae bacterium IS3]
MISKNAMFPKQGNFENFGEECKNKAERFFCTVLKFLNICKKPLRFIFALRIYETFRSIAKSQ